MTRDCSRYQNMSSSRGAPAITISPPTTASLLVRTSAQGPTRTRPPSAIPTVASIPPAVSQP